MPTESYPADAGEPELESVTAHISRADVERLDIAAARRGIDRNELIAQAIDAFLARETWSGGFIAPPPPMEVPGPLPWKGSTFRFRRRD